MASQQSRKRQRESLALASIPSGPMITSRIIFNSILISMIATTTMHVNSIATSAFTAVIVPTTSQWGTEPINNRVVYAPIAYPSNRLFGTTSKWHVSLLTNSRGASATIMLMTSTSSSSRSTNTAQPNFQSDDPYAVLGLSRSVAGLDKKELKRVYKRLALQYHPDMITNIQSSTDEKKIASDRFAKINWAYEKLMNNATDNAKPRGGTSSQSKSSTAVQDEWVPPHRRAGSYSRSGSTTSGTNDNYGSSGKNYNDSDSVGGGYKTNRNLYTEDEVQYDTGGDSFGKIFSDLMNDVATVASSRSGSSGGSGILGDFVEFLEKNINGVNFDVGVAGSRPTGLNDDAELRLLLQTGTIDEIGNEMDETDFIVQQLMNKKQSIMNDIIMITAEIKQASSYSEKITLQQQLEEFNAKSTIVVKYIKDAQKRLLALQNKYKELIVVNGANSDPRVRRNQQQSATAARAYDDIRRETSATGRNRETTPSGRSDSTADGETNNRKDHATNRSDNNDDDRWKSESFGSFGRARSSRGSSSRSRRQSTTASNEQAPRDSYSKTSTSRATPSQPKYSSRSSASTYTAVDPTLPPHRRAFSYNLEYDQYLKKEEDRRRLRDIKVDEEFDKLKRDLGL